MTAILSPGSYFGSIEGRHQTGPFALVETAYLPGERIPEHYHARPYFCLVLRGNYEESTSGGATSCRTDTVVFHPPGNPHRDRFGESGGSCFNVECDGGWLDSADVGLDACRGSVYLSDDSSALWMRRLRIEARQPDRYSPLSVDGLARALAAAVARRAAQPGRGASGGPSWLAEAVALIDRDYGDRLGLAEVARRVGIHPRHLARAFRDRMGCSVGTYLEQRRVEAACRLLRETGLSISRVAYCVGFVDQSHLARTLRRHVGLSPAGYRRFHTSRASGTDTSLGSKTPARRESKFPR